MEVTDTNGKEYTIEPKANLADVDLRNADLRVAILESAN